MQVQVDIAFDELIKIVKKLPAEQLDKLKAEITSAKPKVSTQALENLLLNGPVATEEELDIINKNRKEINQWRTK